MPELLAGDHHGRGGAHQADLAGDRRRGVRMIAGDHDHLDAGVAACLESRPALPGAADLRGRRARRGSSPLPRLASSTLSGSSRQAKASTRRPFSAIASAAARKVAARSADSSTAAAIHRHPSAARQHDLRRALAIEHLALRRRHAPSRAACDRSRTGSRRRAGCAAAPAAHRRPARRARPPSDRRASRVRRRCARLSGRGSSARLQRSGDAARQRGELTPGSRVEHRPRKNSRLRRHAVLRERAGLVGADDRGRSRASRPAGRWRMSALRFAMRCEPIASASVTVGSSPSGTLATMMPMANMKFAQNGSPIAWPMKKKSHARARARARRRCG